MSEPIADDRINFEYVLRYDPIVQQGMDAGIGDEEIIVAMFKRHVALMEKLRQLYTIAPKRIEVGGHNYVWHCPDHLIPKTV